MKKEDYICRKCKSHWDLSEAQFVEDDCTGFQVCPFCGSDDIADAVKCPECGGWYDVDDTYHDYCEGCIKEFATPESVISYCEDEKETEAVEVNRGVLSILSSIGIDVNKLLTRIALEKANSIEYEDHLKACSEIDVKVELDTGYFMNYEHSRRNLV